MCFKKKKRLAEIYIEDRKTLMLAAQEIDVLIVLDRDKRFKAKLEALKDELLYLSPRENKDVFEIDKKIKEKIGDLKLILNKSDDDVDIDNVEKIINTMFVMAKERDAKELK